MSFKYRAALVWGKSLGLGPNLDRSAFINSPIQPRHLDGELRDLRDLNIDLGNSGYLKRRGPRIEHFEFNGLWNFGIGSRRQYLESQLIRGKRQKHHGAVGWGGRDHPNPSRVDGYDGPDLSGILFRIRRSIFIDGSGKWNNRVAWPST